MSDKVPTIVRRTPHRFRGLPAKPQSCARCGLPPDNTIHVDKDPAIDMEGAVNRPVERVWQDAA